jgi:hypothetical protein
MDTGFFTGFFIAIAVVVIVLIVAIRGSNRIPKRGSPEESQLDAELFQKARTDYQERHNLEEQQHLKELTDSWLKNFIAQTSAESRGSLHSKDWSILTALWVIDKYIPQELVNPTTGERALTFTTFLIGGDGNLFEVSGSHQINKHPDSLERLVICIDKFAEDKSWELALEEISKRAKADDPVSVFFRGTQTA